MGRALSFLLSLLSLCSALKSTFGPVRGLPGQPSVSFAQYAGLVVVNSTCPAAVFAWLAQSASPSNDLVVFLNGGPGSSSFLGWFFEGIGPFLITPTLGLTPNPNTWNRRVDVIMFDQPAGVGLGYASSPTCLPQNLVQSTAQLGQALQWIVNFVPGLQSKNVWIFGESYAGTWIPLLADYLLETGGLRLAGIGVGDGWVNPRLQQMTYAVFADLHGLIVGPSTAQTAVLQRNCAQAIDSYPPHQPLPSSVNDICNLIEEYIVNVSNVNVLDVRLSGSYDFSQLSDYLNRQPVFDALNVPLNVSSNPWSSDSDPIGNLFATGEQNSFDYVYSELWDKGLPTLLYNGVFDMDCNFAGTDVWTAESSWGQRVGWAGIARSPWLLSGVQVGMLRSLHPVTQVVLNGAGHLVPHDIPDVARAMMEMFVFNKTLMSSTVP